MNAVLKYTVSLFLLICTLSLPAQSRTKLYKDALLLKKQGKVIRATRAFDQALESAQNSGDKKLQMKCHQQLAELTDNVVQYKKAIEHYKAFSRLYNEQEAKIKQELRASNNDLSGAVKEKAEQIDVLQVDSLEKEKEITELTEDKLLTEIKNKDLEIENREREIEVGTQKLQLSEEKNKQNRLYAILGIFGLAAAFLVIGFVQKQTANNRLSEKNEIIALEKQKSEDLLLNILPVSVANELKETGHTLPSSIAEATVMFTDFKGFTSFAEKLSPEEVVSELDFCFRAFDKIIAKRKIEKIKTIGDAYLCVSGLPLHNPTHAKDILEAALEFQEFLANTGKEHAKQGKDFFEMRVGIHSGPLVAGVVGSTKFAYDIWGDTVNIAARMEQSGEPGKINVSQTVYEQLSGEYSFEYRGELEAKNKGLMRMYFVSK